VIGKGKKDLGLKEVIDREKNKICDKVVNKSYQ